jgi:hypothetical protein
MIAEGPDFRMKTLLRMFFLPLHWTKKLPLAAALLVLLLLAQEKRVLAQQMAQDAGAESSAAGKWLIQVSGQFQDVYEKTIAAPYKDGVDAARRHYRNGLEAALQLATLEGRMRDAELLRRDRERFFSAGRGAPSEPAAVAAVEEERRVFTARVAALEKIKQESARKLYARLDAALVQNIELLKQRQLLADAALLTAKREELAKEWLQPPMAVAKSDGLKEELPELQPADLKDAIKWLISHDWRVRVLAGHKATDLTDVESLSVRHVAFHLVELGAPGKMVGRIPMEIKDGDLDRIAALRGATCFSVTDRSLGDRAFEFLREWKSIDVFKVQGAKVTDQLGEKLAKFRSLREVNVQNCPRLTGKFVETLAETHPKLVALNLGVNGNIGDESVEALLKFKDLEVLNLHRTGLTDAGLARLVGLKKLRVLDLTDTKVTPAGLTCVSQMKLEELNFLSTDSSSFPESVMALAAALPKTQELKISGAGFGVEHAQALARFKQLRCLYLRGACPESGALAALRDIKSLEKIQCSSGRFGDEHAAELSELMQVKIVDLSHTSVTDKGLAKLTHNKRLKEVFVHETPVSEMGAEALSRAVRGVRVVP